MLRLDIYGVAAYDARSYLGTVPRLASIDQEEGLFGMGLKWDQAEEIAEVLAENHPGLDPLQVRFVDLRQWIIDLDEFGDDKAGSSEGKLEAIQMAWKELYDESESAD
jgi:FeS assembly protein IscX